MFKELLEKYLFGYGIFPHYPLLSGLAVILIFFIFFWLQEVGSIERSFHLCKSQSISAISNALKFSSISFLATPQGDGLFIWIGIIERILGLIISSSFLVVLAKKILR
jgi:hypothetical protein